MLPAIDDFATYQISEKGHSKLTVEAYRRDLLSLLRFLSLYDLSSWQDVNQRHILEFLKIKNQKNAAITSVARALIAIKVFFLFLKREQLVDQNVTRLLETPKAWQKIPEVMSLTEVECLLSSIDTSSFQGLRDKAILELLYSTGIRVSELCQLQIIDVDDEFIRIKKGKGSKERIIPIGAHAIFAIDKYLSIRDGVFDREISALFINKQGKPLSRVAVWAIVKHYVKKMSLKKSISPHTFRHSYATHLLENGADLRIIQEMLGHANINNTDKYTHVTCNHLKSAFYAAHPRP